MAPELKRYRRKPSTPVIAVQLDLDTAGFDYEKWGSTQRCKPGDYVVKNGADTYTVDRETFERTYRALSPGLYTKTGRVFAERATSDGSIATKEGATRYAAGDMLVYNAEGRQDGYAMSAEQFDTLYEPDES